MEYLPLHYDPFSWVIELKSETGCLNLIFETFYTCLREVIGQDWKMSSLFECSKSSWHWVFKTVILPCFLSSSTWYVSENLHILILVNILMWYRNPVESLKLILLVEKCIGSFQSPHDHSLFIMACWNSNVGKNHGWSRHWIPPSSCDSVLFNTALSSNRRWK